MKQIRIPSFLENLFRDLRDRRLLLPAIALVLGLLAVPILLKSHAASNGQVSVSRPDAETDEGVPAVVAQQVGVTNYRKRLNQLQSKNPFHQQYTATPDSSSGAKLQSASTEPPSASSSSTDTGSTVGSTSSTSPPSTGSVPPVSSSTSSGGTTSASSPPETSSGSSNSAAPHHHTNPDFRYYAWRISVKVGEPNDLKKRSEVQRLALLPSDARPVVSFLGATEDGSKAVFLVSSDVDSVTGEGHCVPSHSSCQYYVMKPGEKAHFHYAPNHTRYNLILLDIHPVDVTDKLPKKPTGQAQPQRKLPILGDG